MIEIETQKIYHFLVDKNSDTWQTEQSWKKRKTKNKNTRNHKRKGKKSDGNMN